MINNSVIIAQLEGFEEDLIEIKELAEELYDCIYTHLNNIEVIKESIRRQQELELLLYPLCDDCKQKRT